ncbi:MAG: glutamate-5-semialdehyde dehydrogenase [Clostridiales bacterium]|nr:glutamate-5-semialdehyde dehydrogenase [Clostridiales bacterium]
MKQMGERALKAKAAMAGASTELKNRALLRFAQAMEQEGGSILSANAGDLEAGRQMGLSDSLLDRLMLNEARIADMADGMRQVAALEDPVGETIQGLKRPGGLEIHQVRVPLGVIGIIYEARPNVTADAASLCLKSGNVTILRGGKEAFRSNRAIAELMRQSLSECGLPEDALQLVQDTSRESARELMRMNGYLDVLIPRGGAGLIRSVVENATVPVIETGTGNCHVYVDKDADLEMAAEIVFNAKTSRVSVCNACESLVVHRAVAKEALPKIAKRLAEKQVELRGDAEACRILPGISAASEADFSAEYLDYIISVKVVGSLEEAIRHINACSTGHSECIVTENYQASRKFMQQVDSAAVYTNASTRFTDGNVFGLGAEIGISTQKLHARGPMGLRQLTSTKFLVFGNGQVR